MSIAIAQRVRVAVICGLLITVAACTPPSKALKPVAEQNQDNIAVLSNNINVLLALYEPLLQASAQATLYQHIGKVQQEIIAVVGPPMLPAPQSDWATLFEQAALKPIPKREKYFERYQLAKLANERGLEQDELAHIKRKEGWIYNAATDSQFTPVVAHDLLKTLLDLRQEHGNTDIFYQEATRLLMVYDPKLSVYSETVEAAFTLLDGLKQELQNQITTANIHAQAFAGFTASEVDVQQAVKAAAGGMDSQQLIQVLDALSQKYLEQPTLQDAAVEFLSNNFKKFLKTL